MGYCCFFGSPDLFGRYCALMFLKLWLLSYPFINLPQMYKTEMDPLIYTAEPDSISEYIKKVWKFKRLIYTFTYHEIKTQYAGTRLSLLWLVFRPLMVISIFAFVFNNVFHIPGLKSPYPLFAFTGLMMWNNFSFMVNTAGNVVATNHAVIGKMRFPRLILVLAKAASGLVELGVSIFLVLILMAFFKQPLLISILSLPVFILINLFIGTGIAIWLNALSVKYTDIQHLVPNLLGFLVWLTPVFYPATIIPSRLSFLVYLNPIAGVIQGCRWAFLGDSFPSIYFAPVYIVCFLLTLLGLVVFIKREDAIMDNA